MSSENWQDFEVKCINDACVCARVHACVLVFAEEAEVPLCDGHFALFVFGIMSIFCAPPPGLRKLQECSNKFHVCGCVFVLRQGHNNTETLLSDPPPFLTNLPPLRTSIIFISVKEKKKKWINSNFPFRAEKVTDEEFQPCRGISK